MGEPAGLAVATGSSIRQTPGEGLMDGFTAYILPILLALIQLGTLANTWYQARANKRKTAAEGDSALAQAASGIASASGQVVGLQERAVTELRGKIEQLENRQTEVEACNQKLEQINEELSLQLREATNTILDLRDWVDRLCHQVIALGGVPVQMRKNTPSNTGPTVGGS